MLMLMPSSCLKWLRKQNLTQPCSTSALPSNSNHVHQLPESTPSTTNNTKLS